MAGRRGAGEGTISRRQDGRWEARFDLGWENGNRKRKSIYGRTRAEVAFKLNEALATKRRGIPLVDEQQQLGSWLDRWLSELVEPRVRRSTFVSYRTIVKRHLQPALGKQRLAKLNPQALLRYMEAKRAEGLTARTIQYHHAVLRKALSDAERLGIVTRNVARLVSALVGTAGSRSVNSEARSRNPPSGRG